MTKSSRSDEDELLLIAGGGDDAALRRLLDRHRGRLEREELPFAEIATALGLGLGAVKMRHLRALDRLRRMLDKDSQGDSK
jgi:Sigma-70, region 4